MEFEEFPKMARLSRECIITEKLDGTNGQICIEALEGHDFDRSGLRPFRKMAGHVRRSRTRWIVPGDDNYGFARLGARAR